MSDWILIVDDDAMNIRFAGTILSKEGYRAAGMKSGSKLLDYVRKNGAPALVLLDILMPDMDGYETYEALRNLEKEMGLPTIPVAFLSAEESPETKERCENMGAFAFVKKPLNGEDLIAVVKRGVTKE